MKFMNYNLKIIVILILSILRLYSNNHSDDNILSLIYESVYDDKRSGLGDLKNAYPAYFESGDSGISLLELSCKNIIKLLSNDEVKLLSITNFGGKEFAYVSIILITNKKVYYSKVSCNRSLIIAKSVNENLLSSIHSKISNLKKDKIEIDTSMINIGAYFTILYHTNNVPDTFVSVGTSPFPEFSIGIDRIFKQIRLDLLAYLGFDALGQGITESNYRILAKELNMRVSKYLYRNELLLLRNKYHSHTLNELLFYYATSDEKTAPLLYLSILNINEILKYGKLFSLPRLFSKAEMDELKQRNSLLAKYILYSVFMKSGKKNEAYIYENELNNNEVDTKLIDFWKKSHNN